MFFLWLGLVIIYLVIDALCAPCMSCHVCELPRSCNRCLNLLTGQTCAPIHKKKEKRSSARCSDESEDFFWQRRLLGSKDFSVVAGEASVVSGQRFLGVGSSLAAARLCGSARWSDESEVFWRRRLIGREDFSVVAGKASVIVLVEAACFSRR